MGDLGLRNDKVQTSPSILQERLSKKADVAGRNVWEQKEGGGQTGVLTVPADAKCCTPTFS